MEIIRSGMDLVTVLPFPEKDIPDLFSASAEEKSFGFKTELCY